MYCPYKSYLYNAYSSEISIEYKDEKREFRKAKLGSGEKIQVNKLLEREFRIYHENALLNYRFDTIPESFVKHVGFGPFFKREAKAQFYENQCIYLVSTEMEFPADIENKQEGSFPLCPIETISGSE